MSASRTLKICALLTALLLPALLCACSELPLSPASVGCDAGKAGEDSYLYHEDEPMILPSEIVTAYALHTVGADAETCKRVLFGGDLRYCKQMLTDRSMRASALTAEMNARAATEAPGLTFGSVTGTRDGEKQLYALLGEEAPAFEESVGTLSALKKAAEAITADAALSEALSSSVIRFADGSTGTRSAPPLSKNGQYALPGVLWYLGGSGIREGRTVYTAFGAMRLDGQTAFAAVCADSGNADALYYAACDFGNLCGLALGQSYALAYSPSKDPDGAGMVAGSSIFGGAVLILVIAAAGALLLASAAGIAGVIKRNREGRKKYAPRGGGGSGNGDGNGN